MAAFTKKKRVSIVVLLLLALFMTLLTPLQAWARAIRVTPHLVVAEEDFSQGFLLVLEDDELVASSLSEAFSLGGDFKSLGVSEVFSTDGSTVTVQVYGGLAYDTGRGTITLSGQALEGGEDLTAVVTVEQKEVPEPGGTIGEPEEEERGAEDPAEPELVRIEIARLPDKTIYCVGEELDLTGLVVIGVYSDGTEKELSVTPGHIRGFDSSEAASGQEVLVIYEDKETSFTVDIVEPAAPMAITGEGEFAGGSGTQDDPYQIATPEQLALLHEDLDACYILVADIDLKDYLSEAGDGYNEGKGWLSIGSGGNPFRGSFDGNGHVIWNLTINRPEETHYIGFFGRTEGADLRNIKLENVIVLGQNDVGGLVGYMKEGTIESCHVSGSVQGGKNRVGGLVGSNCAGKITASSAEVKVTASGELSMSAGGLVGLNEDGRISDSHAGGDVFGQLYVGGLVGENLAFSDFCLIRSSAARGQVSGINHVGGLVGSNNGSIIMDTYAVGPAEGEEDVGGLVGTNANGSVSDSFAVGTVTGESLVGGLVGANNNGIVSDCYAAGEVGGAGSTGIGGLVGWNGGEIYSSYYDTDTTGQEDTGKGEPRTTEEMQLRSTFEDWDFIDVWGIEDGEGYPKLRWQEDAPQSGFAVEVENSWVKPGGKIRLDITDAMDAGGKWLTGTYQVKIYSDVEDKNIIIDDVKFADGEAVVTVTLHTEGRHKLRVFVEGVSYSNLVSLDVWTLEFAGGTGTPEDPFLVENADQLNQVRRFTTAHFKLNNDIDLGTPPYNEGKGWEPIGQFEAFQGGLDGSGYVIKNLTIERPEEEYAGLFGKTRQAVLKNIKLENVKVTGRVYAGGLAGYMEDGIIEACHVSGSVKAGYNVGGLVGTLEGGHISASSVKVKVAHPGGLDGSYWNAGGLAAENLLAVSASPSAIEKVYEDDYSNAGGLVGENLMGFISNSHAAGEVSGLMNVGGLVGHNSQGSLSRVSAEGRVTGLLFVGGVAGSSAGGSAAASWSGTEVTGNYFVGGLFGVMVEGTMSACFIGKDSAVSGEHAVGGLVGYLFDGEVTNSYSEARVTGIDGREVGGGLVGVITTLWEGATIAHCYAAGPVMDFVMMGGLVGFSEGGDIRGCYYGRESTGRSDQDNGWGIPKTTAEMKRQATFSGWDFDEMWSIVEGYTYPYLKWQDQYCFNVALAQTGAVKAGQAFAVLISNAADPVGLPLEGERKVTVTSDLEGGEEVYSGLVTFVDGTATVLLTLRQPDAHPLTVRVAGVPGQGNLDVAVEAAGGRRTAVRREESPKTVPMPVKEGAKISLPAELDKSSGVARGEVEAALLQEAFAGAEANEQGVKLVEIEIAAVEGAAVYEGILPAAVLNAAGAEGAFSIHTALGTVTVPGNLLSALEPAGVEKISLTIAAADKTKLPRDLQALIGPRPVIELGLNIDGAKVHWRNEEAPVTVSLPYTPTEEELADPEHITVWYIDGEGNGVAVPSGRYDPVTGKVTFSIISVDMPLSM